MNFFRVLILLCRWTMRSCFIQFFKSDRLRYRTERLDSKRESLDGRSRWCLFLRIHDPSRLCLWRAMKLINYQKWCFHSTRFARMARNSYLWMKRQIEFMTRFSSRERLVHSPLCNKWLNWTVAEPSSISCSASSSIIIYWDQFQFSHLSFSHWGWLRNFVKLIFFLFFRWDLRVSISSSSMRFVMRSVRQSIFPWKTLWLLSIAMSRSALIEFNLSSEEKNLPKNR